MRPGRAESGEAMDQSRYMGTIKAARRKFKGWHDEAEACEARYESAQKRQRARRLNTFWSNLEITKPAVYSRAPTPQIERRFNAGDRIARLASEILTRAVLFFLSESEFDTSVKSARDDWMIAGLGQVWFRYEPVFGEPLTQPPAPDAQPGQAAPPMLGDAGEQLRSVDFERVVIEHARWKGFGYWPMRDWASVEIVWRDVHLTKPAATARFGADKANTLNYDIDPSRDDDDTPAPAGDATAEEAEREARVIECWDKRRRFVVWLNPKSSGAAAVLGEKPDPLKLQGFFPCPRPLFATLERKALIPIPDYVYFRDQDEEIDGLTAKIGKLTKAVKVRGAYNAAAEGLEKILKDTSDAVEKLEPVKNWPHLQQQGGLKAAIEMIELGPVLEALKALVELRREVKNDLYEATGVSDILRGATDAGETLGAQELKSRYAGLRLQDRQTMVATFARDGLAIVAEIVSEHFSPQTLAMLTGLNDPDELANILGDEVFAPPPEAQPMAPPAMQAGPGAIAQFGMQPGAAPQVDRQAIADELFGKACELLRGDVLRTFKIDIETDSTVSETIVADQQAIEKLMQALERVLGRMVSLQGAPALMPMFKEILLLALRKYRVGRAIEGRVESSIDQAIAEMKAKPSGPLADPDILQQVARMLQSYKDRMLELGAVDPQYEATLKAVLELAGGQGGATRGGNGAALNGAGGAPN